MSKLKAEISKMKGAATQQPKFKRPSLRQPGPQSVRYAPTPCRYTPALSTMTPTQAHKATCHMFSSRFVLRNRFGLTCSCSCCHSSNYGAKQSAESSGEPGRSNRPLSITPDRQLDAELDRRKSSEQQVTAQHRIAGLHIVWFSPGK